MSVPAGLLLLAADVAGRGAGAAVHAAHPVAALALALRRLIALAAGAGGEAKGDKQGSKASSHGFS